jgi:hypothetical protein
MRLPTLCLVREKMSELPQFREIGKRMLLAWQEGVTNLRDRRVYFAGDWPADKRLKVSPTRESWKILDGPWLLSAPWFPIVTLEKVVIAQCAWHQGPRFIPPSEAPDAMESSAAPPVNSARGDRMPEQHIRFLSQVRRLASVAEPYPARTFPQLKLRLCCTRHPVPAKLPSRVAPTFELLTIVALHLLN